MKKIYSFAKQATIAVAILFSSFISTQTFGQCPGICGIPIAENFNNTGGGTAGFSGDLLLASQSGNGFLQKTNVVSTTVYTVNTPTYQLPNNASSIAYGFSLFGPTTVGTVRVTALYVSTISGQLATADFGTQNAGYCGSGSNRIAVICNTRGLPPGLPAGGRYKLKIELTANEGNGGNNDVIQFDDYRTTDAIANSPLPVTFISFTAKKTGLGTQLNWQVAAEDNVNHYEVERSFDGNSYSSITSVRNPKTEKYSYLDAGAANTVYYRVKSVDNDGQYKYSNIARIINGVESIMINAFPQPVISQLTFQHPVAAKSTTLTLSSVDGRILSTLRPATGSTQTLIDMSKLQKGMYLMRFDDGVGNVQTMKLIKQ